LVGVSFAILLLLFIIAGMISGSGTPEQERGEAVEPTSGQETESAQATASQKVTDDVPTIDPKLMPSATTNHDDLDHISLAKLWPLVVEDFHAYCGIIRDDYWHVMKGHDSSTFVFVYVAARRFDFPPNEIARRLTMCGLDLNGEACVGTPCDWETPPRFTPDGTFIPPKLKDQE
jgi:hypothetical protein